ncbi:MAG: hypothetical protein J0G94_18335 [Sphingomonadales bacterium]|nr:hypothetical protein [Sphingomonadales bacterium]
MQHIGDLEPLGQPDFFADHAPLGRYSAKRSRWRFAVGSLVVGFDRASEQIQAEKGRPDRRGRRGADFGQRLMILVGALSSVILSIAAAGWLWTTRGAILGQGERVETPIVDRGAAALHEREAAGPVQTVIPTSPPKARLTATIERGGTAPAVAPAPRATVPIAEGKDIQPRPAVENPGVNRAPDQAIVASGNFLLIPAVGFAVSRAMTSGEAQNWEAGDYHGLVVVGDADRRDGKSCRQGTVLLRDGSNQGRTQRFERCA